MRLTDDRNTDRITEAWQQCKDWIAIDDGTVTEIILLDVPTKRFFLAIPSIVQSDTDFNLNAWDDRSGDEILTLQELEKSWAENTVRNCTIDYRTTVAEFRFSPRLVIDRCSSELLDLDITFWPRDVFPPAVERKSRFDLLIRYVLQLQLKLDAKRVVIAPENLDDPRRLESNCWITI